MFVIISAFALLINESGYLLDQKLTVYDILLMSAVLCATDTVAVLNIVKEAHFPLLHSVLFGEGLINDATSIVVFRSLKNFIKSEDTDFTINTRY